MFHVTTQNHRNLALENKLRLILRQAGAGLWTYRNSGPRCSVPPLERRKEGADSVTAIALEIPEKTTSGITSMNQTHVRFAVV